MTKSERKQTSFDILKGEDEVPRKIPEAQDLPDEEDLKYEKNNRLLGDWLDIGYTSLGTKRCYYSLMRRFLGYIYPNDAIAKIQREHYLQMNENEIMKSKKLRKDKIEYFLDKYVADSERVFLDDFRFAIRQMVADEYAPMTINGYMIKVVKFFDRMDLEKYKISKRDLDDVKRGLMPPAIPSTQDEIPSKEELKQVIAHLGVMYRAIILFLISTGSRIGETVTLKVSDLMLETDPPWINIALKETKLKVGGRKVWFTNETRDAISAWLKVKNTRTKRGGRRFDQKLLFGITPSSVGKAYNLALKKTGLDTRDANTKVRYRKYHLHTLRKFFSTEMEIAGMGPSFIDALMGHSKGLDKAYKRPRHLAELYVKYMNAVTIFEKDVETEIREEYDKIKAEKDAMDKKDTEVHTRIVMIAKALGIEDADKTDTASLQYDILYRIESLLKQIRPSP